MRRRRLGRVSELRTSELALAAGVVLIAAAVLLLVLAGGQTESGRDAARTPTPSASEARERQPSSPAQPCGSGAGPEGEAAARRARRPAPGRAAPAAAFVDSIGVNVHLGYTDTPYARRDLVERKLRQLGVRYVRDGLNPGQPEVYAAWRALASCGIRLDLLVGDPLHRHDIGSLESQLALVKRERLPGALVSIESPNELDIQGASNWRPLLLGFQRRLHRLVKSDPELSPIPIVGPSVVGVPSHRELGDVSGLIDYGNIHPYPSGQPPDRDAHLNREFAIAEVSSGAKPIQATETGYHTATKSQSPHLPASEHAAGVYMPRLYLDYFRRGIARTFAYELLDEHPDPDRTNQEADFGLLRNDFSEKPAFVALKRLISLLRDPGRAFEPGRLRYTLRGAPSRLRRVLLEKRDGSFYLALWQDDSVWNPRSRRAEKATSHHVRLVLPRRARHVSVYRPSESAGPLVRRSNVGSLALATSPAVAVVKITP